MNISTLARCALATVALATVGANAAHAQQAFETKYVAPRPGTDPNELVPLPTLGIVPVGAAPLHADVAKQLSEAVQRGLDASTERRFEIQTRADGAQVRWALLVDTSPRTGLDALTATFTDHLVTCLHSLADDVDTATLNVLLSGGALRDETERGRAIAAGSAMLVNWRTDQCRTRRNELPFWQRNRDKLTAATRGMLTDRFDPLVYNGQPLLDVILVLKSVFYQDGGIWVAHHTPALQTAFEGAVGAGLLTTAQTSAIAERELASFWDWAVLAVSTKLGLARSFLEITGAGCVAAPRDLDKPFQMARCVSERRIQVVSLQVGAQTYTTVQRVPN